MNAEVLSFKPRNEFPGKMARTFTPEFEMKRASLVDKLSNEQREIFFSYELMQMETHLGERFNVNISRFDYDIINGQLYGKDMDEPFLESIKRGRNIRRFEGNNVDFEREDAEVEGFSKIQKLMTDEDTPVGTMMLSISPKGGDGSSYQHNFYDIFTLNEKDGKRFVEARRYTSGLETPDYEEKLSVFMDINLGDVEPAAYFLSNPIAITNTLTPDDVHNFLHKDHESVDAKTFEIIKKHCKGLAEEYARSLLYEPENIEKHGELFNAYINKAEELERRINEQGLENWENISPLNNRYLVEQDVATYGGPVVEKMTGCGMSGGYETDSGKTKNSPFSVSEFGKKWEYHKGDCVVCKTRYTQVGPCNICKDCEKKFDSGEL